MGRPRAESDVRDVPRPAASRTERDMARDREGRDDRAPARRDGRAPRIHVRPEPRCLRAAPAAQPAVPPAEPRDPGNVARDARPGAAAVALEWGVPSPTPWAGLLAAP